MSHDHQHGTPSQSDDLPSWATFHLGKFDNYVTHSAGVIMGHHLIVVVTREYSEKMSEYFPSLLAFNLEDHSIQEAEMDGYSSYKERSDYSLLKYGENQIIKYCTEDYYEESNMICITVESFEPFKVKFEDIEDEDKWMPAIFTAQIHKDCLYIYGNSEDKENELWSVDLKNFTWKLCKTTGEAPPELNDNPNSFIYQDNLFVYGPSSTLPDLFMLDLNSMTWKKIVQTKEYLGGMKGTVYQNHFVTLENTITSEENTLCLLNLETKNTWSTFDLKGLHFFRCDAFTDGLMTYKNLVFGFEVIDCGDDLILAIMNMESLGISAPKSAEEQHLCGLFMSNKESDVALKIEEKVIHAHKQVLMKKSRYFENVFNSGMAESKQDVIEIKDCEYEIFQEFLRWIYQGTVNLKDANQVFRLHVLADKYLQADLREKCINFLTSIINTENVYRILDFAHQENSTYLKSWCLKCLKDKFDTLEKDGLRDSLDIYVADLIKYLHRQEDSEWKENNRKLRNLVFGFILDIFEEGEKLNYEDFLLKNIEMDTIFPLAHFLSPDEDEIESDLGKKNREIFENSTARLKEAAFQFLEANFQVIMATPEGEDLPESLLDELSLYTAKNQSNTTTDSKNEKKRMEPSLSGSEEENPELKKTKK